MQISVIENTTECLHVRMRPNRTIAIFGFGMSMLLAGPFCIGTMGIVTRLSVERDQLVWRESFPMNVWPKEISTPLADVQSVGTEDYVITVQTQSGTFPIPMGSLDGDQKQQLAAELDAAIRTGERYQYDSDPKHGWLGLGLGVFCMAAGVFVLCLLQTSVLTCDRSRHTICVLSYRWLLQNRRENCIPISSRLKLDVEDCTDPSHPAAVSKAVHIRGREGVILSLSPSPMFNDQSAEEIVRLVTSWLKQEAGSPRV